MKRVLSGLTGAALVLATAGPAFADELVLYGAGSLREAMTQIARDFHARTGTTVRTEFGPSGVMRERIEKGERVDLLASADRAIRCGSSDRGRPARSSCSRGTPSAPSRPRASD